jgi:hypothetical protein
LKIYGIWTGDHSDRDECPVKFWIIGLNGLAHVFRSERQRELFHLIRSEKWASGLTRFEKIVHKVVHSGQHQNWLGWFAQNWGDSPNLKSRAGLYWQLPGHREKAAAPWRSAGWEQFEWPFLGIALSTKWYIRFVSLKVRDHEQAIAIPSSLVMVVSTGNKGDQNELD